MALSSIDIFKMISTYRKNLLKREYLIDIFTICEYDTFDTEISLYPGKIVKKDNNVYYLDNDLQPVLIKSIDKQPIANIGDIITITKDNIENYFSDSPIDTTYGRYIANYVLLVNPFLDKYKQDKIPSHVKDLLEYKNKVFPSGKVRSTLPNLALEGEFNAIEVNNFIEAFSYIDTFPELNTASTTSKVIQGFESINKKKNELMEKYKDKLEQKDALVMHEIESELIQILKDESSTDPAFAFLAADATKRFHTSGKRMFCSMGMLEDFTDKTKFSFIGNSLDDGLDVNSLVDTNNDIRFGTYSRGTETAKGGEIVNFLVRVFLDMTISEDDCGSKDGKDVTLYPEVAYDYIGRYVIDGNGYHMLTRDEISKNINKTITIRSPMRCRTQSGVCCTCMGNNFRQLGVTSLTLLETEPGSTFMYTAMKAMHGVVRDVIDISKLNKYLL